MPRRLAVLIWMLTAATAVLPALAFAQVLVPGGKTEIPFEKIPHEENKGADGKQHTSFFLFAENHTQKAFKDFELELKSCGKAKFQRIKVYPRFTVDENGAEIPEKTDRHADWDVDDNMDGRTNGGGDGWAEDPNSTLPPPGGGGARRSNETDNVDDSPGTTARVDANGDALPVECCAGDVGSSDATKRGTEDDERTSADPGKSSGGYLDGKGGVQPGDTFVLNLEFTELPTGKACKLVVQPSGVGAELILSDAGTRPGLEPGQEYAMAPGTPQLPAYTGFEFALTPGGTFGSIGTRQETSFGGKSHGHDIHYDAANLHSDGRYYFGGIEGLGSWRPNLLLGLKGSGTFGGSQKGLEEDNHPPGGVVDSFVKYQIDGTLTPYVGLTVADFDCSRINVLAGPRITFAKITGTTDESGGGGMLEKFSNHVVQVGPAFGVELDIPITRTRDYGFESGFRVASWGEYLPAARVSGESSTFPFDYRFETEGAFLYTVRAGFFVRFGGAEAPPPPPPP